MTGLPANRPAAYGRIAAALVVTVVAAFLWADASKVVLSDAGSAPARLQITRWAAGELPWTEAEWQQARQDLTTAIGYTPRDATLYEHVALLETLKGRAQWGTGSADSPGLVHYRLALAAQKEAVRLRPLHAPGWASLALLHYAVDDTSKVTFDAWSKALALGPNEPEVKSILKTIVSLAWQVAPDAALAWLEREEPGALARLRSP